MNCPFCNSILSAPPYTDDTLECKSCQGDPWFDLNLSLESYEFKISKPKKDQITIYQLNIKNQSISIEHSDSYNNIDDVSIYIPHNLSPSDAISFLNRFISLNLFI